jgi:hypothetical protein
VNHFVKYIPYIWAKKGYHGMMPSFNTGKVLSLVSPDIEATQPAIDLL